MHNTDRLLAHDLQIYKYDNNTTAYCVNTIAVGAVYFRSDPRR